MIFDIAYLNESISIHAPGKGSDPKQSVIYNEVTSISIHAPGKGSDAIITGETPDTENFNPRSR